MLERLLAEDGKVRKPEDFLKGGKTIVGEVSVFNIELEHFGEEVRQLAIHLRIFPSEIVRGKVFLEQFPLQRRSFGLRSARPEKNCSICHRKPRRSKVNGAEFRRNVAHAG